MTFVECKQTLGDRFLLTIGDHELVIGRPVTQGDTDEGLTPTELLVAAIVGGVARAAADYLQSHRLVAGINVTGEAELASDLPDRLGAVTVVITLDRPVPQEHHQRLLASARRSPVWNNIRQPPHIVGEVSDPDHSAVLS